MDYVRDADGGQIIDDLATIPTSQSPMTAELASRTMAGRREGAFRVVASSCHDRGARAYAAALLPRNAMHPPLAGVVRHIAMANRYIEESGVVAGALADAVSEKAKTGQRQEMGTLGSGNHYLEVQKVITVR